MFLFLCCFVSPSIGHTQLLDSYLNFLVMIRIPSSLLFSSLRQNNLSLVNLDFLFFYPLSPSDNFMYSLQHFLLFMTLIAIFSLLSYVNKTIILHFISLKHHFWSYLITIMLLSDFFSFTRSSLSSELYARKVTLVKRGVGLYYGNNI